ncbi:hypothetical protein P691DRAFT_465994 [Macrolepiota fuliginosa MF-IS2]|uniref:Uncharacterized protein n=1 Tax=Macrolepiota fuliginosa MF-IS2 TaxID=1400762 RepID=A0A9P6C3T7_9AGAR|nr:hypothetical protein P691DRAFT_465994 [Macrolepiota fuliginosa MF-IS2]
MSHISTASSNGRILHPDIPPPSVNAEHHPPPHSAPLALVPGESMGMGKGNTSPRGLWFFKKPNHNRTGSRSSTPSKLGGSPLMERSLSEPNSPTEPTSASAFYERAGTRPNYISKALELLDSSTVRFAGHEDDLSKFYDRYHKLFANGQPINGKIVRRDTPKPNAQDVARLLVRDIEAKLEEMDREMEILESDDSSSSAKASASKVRSITGPAYCLIF